MTVVYIQKTYIGMDITHISILIKFILTFSRHNLDFVYNVYNYTRLFFLTIECVHNFLFFSIGFTVK